ncbi:Hep-Hag [compost metagenome]
MTHALGESTHTEGSMTLAAGAEAHAEGNATQAWGDYSHTEGFSTSTQAGAASAHAEGEGNSAAGRASHAEGGGADQQGNPAPNFAGGAGSHAEGVGTTSLGFASHAEGGTTDITAAAGPVAQADFAHAEGQSTTASGTAAHAEGFRTIASGNLGSHTEGQSTTASGTASHAEGFQTTASGPSAHAEGANSVASGPFSHAEGVSTLASGAYAHAEGANTTADGQASHAEGFMTQAFGANSHAEGENTTVMPGHTGSHIMGRNGSTRFAYSWHLANGLAVGPSLNSAVIEGATGNLYLDGTVISPAAADYAEMFETSDGQALEPGYFVTFDGGSEKIRRAHAGDSYILGVVSGRPAILADSSDLRWHKLLVTDEWDRIQYREVEVPEVKDTEGNVVRAASSVIEPVLNPDWNAAEEYIPRMQRDEWVAVGVVGKLLVRDDGTCRPGGYCMPNAEGIATDASAGYRVMNRTRDDQVRIFVR